MQTAPANPRAKSAQTLLAAMKASRSYQCKSYRAMLQKCQEDCINNIPHHMSLSMHLHVLCMGHCAHETCMLGIVPAAEAYPALLLAQTPRRTMLPDSRQQPLTLQQGCVGRVSWRLVSQKSCKHIRFGEKHSLVDPHHWFIVMITKHVP